MDAVSRNAMTLVQKEQTTVAPARRPIPLGRRCLYAMVPVFLLLTIVEVMARVLVSDDATSPGRFDQIEQIIVYLGNKPGQSIFEPDPDCFWRLRPDVILPPDRGPSWSGRMSNSHGMRSREVSVEESRQRLRVLCFGDSSTFAFGVPFADAWPNQLQHLFDAEAPQSVEVLNAGIPGQTTYQGRQRLKRELEKWKPQLAVITFGNNDGWRWDGLSDHEHARRMMIARACSHLNASHAMRWLINMRQQSVQQQSTEAQMEWAKQATVNYFDPNTSWRPRVDVTEFAANLRAMIHECQRFSCQPILVVWPDRRQLQNQPTWRPAYQEAMRQVAQEADVTCLDLVPLFESGGQWAVERFLPNDVVHLDQAGNEVVSDAVAHLIRKSVPN